MASIGKYTVLQRIATGGMAEVFLVAKRSESGVPVPYALKRILPDVAKDPEIVKMLADEGRLTSRLMHRGIARTVDVVTDPSGMYLIMEYVDGRDFGRVLSTLRDTGRKLSPELVAMIVLRAAEALDYAHRLKDTDGKPLNIVHRDVSPSNVVIAFDGEVRIIDFGIARAEKRLTQTMTGVIKGKYRYMAPEQALGRPVDARADVYSLGVLLYEALAGQKVLPTLTDMELLVAVTRGDVPPLRSLAKEAPPGLARIVARAMEKDLTLRYPSCAELTSDLRAWLTANVPRALRPKDLEQLMLDLFPKQRGETDVLVRTMPDA